MFGEGHTASSDDWGGQGVKHICSSNPVQCITSRVVHSCKLFIVVSIKVLILWISCVDGSTETEKDV